jgi:hypothetical protein
MPKITGPIQRVRPANKQKRAVMTQVSPARFQMPRTATRAVMSSPGLAASSAPASSVMQQSVATSCTCAACTGLQCLERTRFFAGQLLTEADLNNEQSYLLAKNRLHNRYLHGWGVVCGLQVLCSNCEGWVTIEPGYAIDPCGNDIIVCSTQGFNVLQAIQACCTPPPATTNCQPLRYSPPPSCTTTVQKWCITLQYQEQATQMVTPLQQTSVSSSSCGCSGGTSSCTCGCSGSSAKNNGCGCGCGHSSTASTSSSTTTTAGCEATRIIEGFQFGICALPPESTGPQPGTFAYQVELCTKGIVQLAGQAPNFQNNPNQTPQQAYQAVSNYLYTVQQYFAQNPTLTNCQALNALNGIVVPQPTANTTASDYQTVETEILLVLIAAFFDCVCVAALPQCPPNPCDNRVPLACVSVQNGVIVSICHFECRHQLIGATALQYWLEPLFAALWSVVSTAIENFCCGGVLSKDSARLLNVQDAFSIANVTTAGFANAATVNRTINSFVAQKMGASMVNTVNPNLNAVDTRPFIGQPLTTLQQSFGSPDKARETKINVNRTATPLDIQYVDNDPSWDLAATSAGSNFAPAAVTAGQPLTVYVKGNNVVGIEVTDPTRALQLQVQTLSNTVANLQAQLSAAPQPGTAKPPSGKSK